jgi:acyl carrier protein
VRAVLEEASGVELEGADTSAGFMELGLDSLSLTQCAQLLSKRMGAEITFRQMSEDLVSLDALVAHLDAVLPPDAHRPEAPAAPAEVPSAAAGVAGGPMAVSMPMFTGQGMAAAPTSDVARIVAQQLELMARQIALLGGGAPAFATAPVVVAEPAAEVAPSKPAVTNGTAAPAPSAAAAAPAPAEEAATKKTFGAGARIEKVGVALPEDQKAALAKFIEAYIARTKGSKAHAS